MSDAGQILVIDDSERLLAQIEERLSIDGYNVITTTQTIGNARYLRSVDLVIIDFHMPGIDGGRVAGSLRMAGNEKSTALLYVYTSDDRVAADFARYGFDGAFTHKGNLDALSAQVRAAFRLIRTKAAREKLSIPPPAPSQAGEPPSTRGGPPSARGGPPSYPGGPPSRPPGPPSRPAGPPSRPGTPPSRPGIPPSRPGVPPSYPSVPPSRAGRRGF